MSLSTNIKSEEHQPCVTYGILLIYITEVFSWCLFSWGTNCRNCILYSKFFTNIVNDV